MAGQLVTPLDRIEKLTAFGGRQVIAVGLESPGAAGGLQDALTVDPVEFDLGDDVAVILIGPVAKIRFEEVKDADGALRRVHVMKVREAAIVDIGLIEGLLTDQRAAIEAARIAAERAEGIHRLPMGEGDSDFDEDSEEMVLSRNHNAGNHADGFIDGCPLCRLEAEFAAEENGTTVDDELAKRRATS